MTVKTAPSFDAILTQHGFRHTATGSFGKVWTKPGSPCIEILFDDTRWTSGTGDKSGLTSVTLGRYLSR